MTTKTETQKRFDCVEFKRRSQRRLMKEYEMRKDEFASYVDFLKAKVGENEWSRDLWNAIGGAKSK